MERTPIAQLPQTVGEEVELRGWVQAVRDQKKVQFVIVRDETGLVQVVAPQPEPPEELNRQISALTAESAVRLTGTVGILFKSTERGIMPLEAADRVLALMVKRGFFSPIKSLRILT